VEIELEKLLGMITTAVLKELKKQGVTVISATSDGHAGDNRANNGLRHKSEKIDMSKYQTPVLTENHIRRLHELTGEVLIPPGTVITPKAKELIREKGLQVTFV
jgi:trimethylamine:corrinoid methyltransferase-like protein